MASVYDYYRMCNYYPDDCRECPLYFWKECGMCTMAVAMMYARDCEKAIDEWCEKHPEEEEI